MIMTMRRAKLFAWGIAASFLLVHIMMLYIFAEDGVTPMVYFNIFSVFFYIFIAWVIHKEWMAFYAVTVYLEVCLHMTLSVILTGWESGFQITLIGMNVLAFYADYIAQTLKLRRTPMLPFCILGGFLYIGSYIFIHFNTPPYMLPDETAYLLSILWGSIVFFVNIVVLQEFVILTVKSERQLAHQMSHDKLTGLPNRYDMTEFLQNILDKGDTDKWCIAIADIDNFKKVNDTYGHNCGDYVLKTVAEIIDDTSGIHACRWGGEEFVFAGQITNSIENSFERLDRLRTRVENHSFDYEGQKLRITITIGASKYEPGQSIDAWVSSADAKLYDGKQNGKNRVIF